VPLTDPRAIEVRRRDGTRAERVRRDPQVMLDLLLAALPDRR
jgi:hypothetical protein